MSSPAPSPVLSPELLARVQQVLSEGESLADFVEAALRQRLAQRQAHPAAAPAAGAGTPAGGARHAADEMLAQLDVLLQDLRSRSEPAGLSLLAGGSPSR